MASVAQLIPPVMLNSSKQRPRTPQSSVGLHSKRSVVQISAFMRGGDDYITIANGDE